MLEADTIPTAFDADLDLIRDAAREAGEIAMRYFKQSPEVWWKEGQSPVSEADYAVDKFLRETLIAARPDYGWLSEETADNLDRLSAKRTFVVDPIDGTRAYIEGKATWCVSIGVVEDGRSIAGVLDCPVKNEIFEAALGGGARLNGHAISVAPTRAEPAVGGPRPMIQSLDEADRRDFRPVTYVPSLAYRVAMVARGEIDGTFVKPDSHDWDLAGADCILHEAGGKVVDATGEPLVYATANSKHGALAAGSGPLLAKMTVILAKFR
ncbi:3'(2'),5'-bisphosphate nucleotidase CysQ [Tianweitania populi]|uniref:3'(2'),5'-bisphosphate nucleotidase CysQ n=1 Tax=Tianweitania populi TaxID=1607949 RepID=A0A8J3DWL3_9HYPH|nr:3'(2'),5'-bisphosphate nucleotidase CysQ [Tianweitania populi]GHD14053.1 3'(2'),5'-bisphosphate nucleotidase CysQ [Tianweitania populi]